jgi:alpha-ketoglutarate-dependent taurine dioxygenase
MATNPRYDGKPLLRLLELYVLWSIDELAEADGKNLTAITPRLHSTYGSSGAWHDAIAAAMHLPKSMPELIRDTWAKNRKIAEANSAVLGPQQFAEMFVDANFVP